MSYVIYGSSYVHSVCYLVWMLMDIFCKDLFNYKMGSQIWTVCKVLIIFSGTDQIVTIFGVDSYMKFYQKLLISSGAETWRSSDRNNLHVMC